MKYKQNSERIEGRVYQHDLTVKTVQNKDSENFGKEFIAGSLEVAVDEELLNVIPVHFTYVTEMTKSGKKNNTYSVLKKIIDEGKTVIEVGKDEATKVRVDTALSLNEFYTQDDQLVSVKTNEGGFVSIVNKISAEENERNTFSTDIVINNVKRVEADPEKGIAKDYVSIRGGIFNFRGALLPVEFVVKNEPGMKYFEDLGITNASPIYTKVWGRINCATITKVEKEESAFGEAAVKTYERKVKEWVITGASKKSYDMEDPEVITSEEMTKAMQDRELMLADLKKRNEEYKAQKAAGAIPVAEASKAPIVKTGGFSF